MEQKDAKTIQAELAKPFAPEDLEWRFQQTEENGKWGIAVPFVTDRAIQARLDDVAGPDGKQIHIFTIGMRPEIVDGVRLTGVKLELK